MDKAVTIVKNNGCLCGKGDNWDLRILRDLRKSLNKTDLHLMASNLIENRVKFNHLNNNFLWNKNLQSKVFFIFSGMEKIY